MKPLVLSVLSVLLIGCVAAPAEVTSSTSPPTPAPVQKFVLHGVIDARCDKNAELKQGQLSIQAPPAAIDLADVRLDSGTPVENNGPACRYSFTVPNLPDNEAVFRIQVENSTEITFDFAHKVGSGDQDLELSIGITPITFSFSCVRGDYDSLEAVWAFGDGACDVTVQGDEYTPLQQKAVTTAGDTASIAGLVKLCTYEPNIAEKRDYSNFDEGEIEDEISENEEAEKEIKEYEAVLMLCPKYPKAKEIKDYIATKKSNVASAKKAAQQYKDGTRFDDGTFRVGKDIKPGTYVIKEADSGCYWERLDSKGNIIDNNFINSSTRVQATIKKSDYTFGSEDCGTWIRK